MESTGQTSEQWHKVCALSSRLLDLPRADWDALLDQECGDNPALRARVLEICANYSEDDELLGVPVASPLLWDDSYIGHRIGPWEILRLLGEGGMGRVYLAQRADGVFTQYAALKINREHADPDAVRRFHSERRILAMLEHPAIARAIDGGATENGALYLVMEYVENGCPIDEFNPAASVRDKVRLFLRVVDAVEAAHRLQIVHRDLKPSNILVTPAGQPKVLDFGIAKLIQPEAPAADQTDAANSALTPTYASPEQLLREPATLLSDIYSLGAVLYKMLAGRPPHDLSGLNLLQTVRKVTESEPAPPIFPRPRHRRRSRCHHWQSTRSHSRPPLRLRHRSRRRPPLLPRWLSRRRPQRRPLVPRHPLCPSPPRRIPRRRPLPHSPRRRRPKIRPRLATRPSAPRTTSQNRPRRHRRLQEPIDPAHRQYVPAQPDRLRRKTPSRRHLSRGLQRPCSSP